MSIGYREFRTRSGADSGSREPPTRCYSIERIDGNAAKVDGLSCTYDIRPVHRGEISPASTAVSPRRLRAAVPRSPIFIVRDVASREVP